MKIDLTGITRTVILLGPYAIKFPCLVRWRHFLQGLLGNMTERDLWNWSKIPGWEGPPNEILAKVYFCCLGGWFLLMERAEKLATWEEFNTLPLQEFTKISDLKAPNISWIRNRWRLIDYADIAPIL